MSPRISRNTRAATNPSPPLLPGPHTTATWPHGAIWPAAAATARPAVSISVSPGRPMSSIVARSSALISAAVTTGLIPSRSASLFEDTCEFVAQPLIRFSSSPSIITRTLLSVPL